MMTAVGLSAPETAASVRAGIMRLAASNCQDRHGEPFTLAQVPEAGLPDLAEPLTRERGLTSRERRLLRLGALPLAEGLRPVAAAGRRVGLWLALPETETSRPLDPATFLARFARQTGGAFEPGRSAAVPKGRAGGLLAIGAACQWIRDGEADFVLAGGVDTYRDLSVLGTLDREERVKSSGHLDGFIPGEGAGVLLLAGARAARAADLLPLARLSPVGRDFEPGHLYSQEPYRGEGLAGACEEVFREGTLDEPVRTVYSSMNGESHWAKEWGVVLLRHRNRFDPAHGLHHPADCFGDTGAACGPLLVGLAALGLALGDCPDPCLVYASSDRGDRAVVAVLKP